MNNKFLAVAGNFIPYFRELRPFAGSIEGAVLMQKLDQWFSLYPNGFYKFLEPSLDEHDATGKLIKKAHPKYRPGDSWVEELSCSANEFRRMFDAIGVRYNSKADYKLAEEGGDKFAGKGYASYVDRRENVTYYFRNHSLVDAYLNSITIIERPKKSATSEKQSPGISPLTPGKQSTSEKQSPGNSLAEREKQSTSENQSPGNRGIEYPEVTKVEIPNTEKTTDITTTNYQPSGGGAGDSTSGAPKKPALSNEELDDFVTASVWYKKSTGGTITNPIWYQVAIRERIRQDGPNDADLEALRRWNQSRAGGLKSISVPEISPMKPATPEQLAAGDALLQRVRQRVHCNREE